MEVIFLYGEKAVKVIAVQTLNCIKNLKEYSYMNLYLCLVYCIGILETSCQRDMTPLLFSVKCPANEIIDFSIDTIEGREEDKHIDNCYADLIVIMHPLH